MTRLMALAFDAGILNIFFLVISGLFALAASFFVPSDNIVIAIGAGAWAVAAALYLFVFWATAGQTPGMRLMGIRLLVRGSPALGAGPAVRRLAGIGALRHHPRHRVPADPLTQRRRGLQDRMAGTEVVYAPSAARVAPWAELPSEGQKAAA